jgi:hypothetical protein
MINGDETYEFDIEEGWSEPKKAESGAATGHKPNGGGQSSPAAEAAWPIPDLAMFHGFAGEVVATILPNTEADAVALLVNYLAYFGNVIGRVPFFRVGETDHYTNIYGVLVGETASRKGTAADRVTAIFRLIDFDWVQRKTGGMSSGEGLIHEIRDPIFVMKGGRQQLSDPGVSDKRQMIEETEFSQVLNVMQRDGNNLSRMVRDAWDCRPVLKTKVRHSPLMVTNPFISIMAHITPGELQRKLDELAYFNGFANRFLFVCVQRSKEVPDEHPLDPEALARLSQATREAVTAAQSVGRMERTAEAATMWRAIYSKLSAKPPGLIGAATARAEAQVVRLSLIYALLDRAAEIGVEHLTAALALWRYCADSARHIFEPVVCEYDHAAVVLRNLKRAGAAGMFMREIHELFSRNLGADKLRSILESFEKRGMARCERRVVTGTGRPRETWFSV